MDRDPQPKYEAAELRTALEHAVAEVVSRESSTHSREGQEAEQTPEVIVLQAFCAVSELNQPIKFPDPEELIFAASCNYPFYPLFLARQIATMGELSVPDLDSPMITLNENELRELFAEDYDKIASNKESQASEPGHTPSDPSTLGEKLASLEVNGSDPITLTLTFNEIARFVISSSDDKALLAMISWYEGKIDRSFRNDLQEYLDGLIMSSGAAKSVEIPQFAQETYESLTQAGEETKVDAGVSQEGGVEDSFAGTSLKMLRSMMATDGFKVLDGGNTIPSSHFYLRGSSKGVEAQLFNFAMLSQIGAVYNMLYNKDINALLAGAEGRTDLFQGALQSVIQNLGKSRGDILDPRAPDRLIQKGYVPIGPTGAIALPAENYSQVLYLWGTDEIINKVEMNPGRYHIHMTNCVQRVFNSSNWVDVAYNVAVLVDTQGVDIESSGKAIEKGVQRAMAGQMIEQVTAQVESRFVNN